MAAWTIRDLETGDEAVVRSLNRANQPAVGPLDDDRFTLFRSCASRGTGRFEVVCVDEEVVGLFVGLVEGVDYASPNYRWFSQRHPRFAYVDRIALASEARGIGAADALYDRFEDWARPADRPVMCAEVNVEPPNPRSLRFHERRGFVVVDEVAPYGGDERVAMVEKRLRT